jgi:hypothetical protein
LPERFRKSTVTVLRVSRGVAASSGAPHESQKRASSRFSAPHCGQVMSQRVYDAEAPTRPGRTS